MSSAAQNTLFLEPAFHGDAVCTVFAASNGFVPVFAACLQSLLDHASREKQYDLILLHTNVSLENQKILTGMLQNRSNISLRFFNAEPYLRQYDLKTSGHISVETYFRFLIQQILPGYRKVLYLDCDLIVNEDVALLYEEEVEGFLLAAARDPEIAGHVNGADREIRDYVLHTLKLQNPFDYFQAGVLLFNTAEMRSRFPLEHWLRAASVPYRFHDQDVLNIHCQGSVKFLDMSWNLITDCDHTRVSRILVHAPDEILAAYHAARSNPRIIHYAGHRKPWHKSTEDMAHCFWSAARKTPYYEQLLDMMSRFAAEEMFREERRRRSPYWKLRRWVKKLLFK